MGMSIPRLLVIILIIGALFTIIGGLVSDQEDEDYYTTNIEYAEEYVTSMKDGSWESLPSPDDLQQEQSYGNAQKMGGNFFTLLTKGLSPPPVSENMGNSRLEWALAWFILSIYGIIATILGYWLVTWLKNKYTG